MENYMDRFRTPEEFIRELTASEHTDQLFKCDTVKQRKIMEWLAAQGVTGTDISKADMLGPAMVRVTNPAGQYMDLYCDGTNSVRILDITAAREEDLRWCFNNETNEPDTQDWREDLTEDEAAMVDQWDENTCAAFSKMAQRILELDKLLESRRQNLPEQDYELEL